MNDYKRIIGAYLEIPVSAIAYYGSEAFTNGLGETVCDVKVVIDSRMRNFWINMATGSIREYTWDRER